MKKVIKRYIVVKKQDSSPQVKDSEKDQIKLYTNYYALFKDLENKTELRP